MSKMEIGLLIKSVIRVLFFHIKESLQCNINFNPRPLPHLISPDTNANTTPGENTNTTSAGNPLTTEPLVSFPPLIQMEALYLRVSLGQKTLPFFSQIKEQQTKTIV